MNSTCYIFGAGDYNSPPPGQEALKNGLIIAADGGYAQLERWGIRPDLTVGDFDSLGRVPEDTEVVRHPVMKDDTDMMLAAEEGLRRGCKRFLIYGGLGGRLDHTLANLHVLAFLASHKCPAFLLDESSTVTALKNGVLNFSAQHSGVLSLFSWGSPARGITLRGLLYPLSNAELGPERPLGVSNEFLGQEAEIEVRDGTLIALWKQPENTELPSHHFR